jgi:hypothetical protein
MRSVSWRGIRVHIARVSTPFRPADTTPEAWAKQFELYRRMSPAQKAAGVRATTLAVNALALAGLRQQYPTDSEAELRLRLAVRRLGAGLVAQAYGWRAPRHGA